jgi:DNA modification methylase
MPDTPKVTDLSKLKLEVVAITLLIPDPKNARRHSGKQIAKLARIIKEFGWSNPVVIDEASRILAGHARLAAAKRLGLNRVPCLRLTHLSEAQKRALALADNKIGDESSWDEDVLRLVLADLIQVNFDVELTGFDTGDIDIIIDGPAQPGKADPADTFAEPDPTQPAVTRAGDIWEAGDHRILCGNALSDCSYEALLVGERAQMVFTDHPYNVRIFGHVSGLGRRRHREFAQASGEMSDAEYGAFLATSMGLTARYATDGSIHFFCIDWRHVAAMLAAGALAYSELKNICVWAKTNAGMGSLYRSQHELIVVFKRGTAPHQNNVELGRHGRWRSNVWTYPGANAFGPHRDEDLAAHPTVKPVALVADAIRDVSKRGAVVLDPFAGSGTTVLAAERTGRRAAAIEIDPLYVDTAVRRWQTLTGKAAVLEGDGRTFAEIETARLAEAPKKGDR